MNSKINKAYAKRDNINKIIIKENVIDEIPNNIHYKNNYEINNKNKNKFSNKNIINNSIQKIIKDSKNKKYIINIKYIKKNNKSKNLKKSKCLTKYNNKDIAIICSNSNNKIYNKMFINNHINQNIRNIYKYRSISRREISKTKSKSKSKKNKNESFKNNIKSINFDKKNIFGKLIK